MIRALTIGQLVKATGVASKTIRYYEQIDVLPTPSRSAGKYRQYDQSGVRRLRFIRRARALRVPLREIKTLVTALEGGPSEHASSAPSTSSTPARDRAAQSSELQLLQQRLEQVSHRLLASPQRRHKDGYRCLEVDGVDGNLLLGSVSFRSVEPAWIGSG